MKLYYKLLLVFISVLLAHCSIAIEAIQVYEDVNETPIATSPSSSTSFSSSSASVETTTTAGIATASTVKTIGTIISVTELPKSQQSTTDHQSSSTSSVDPNLSHHQFNQQHHHHHHRHPQQQQQQEQQSSTIGASQRDQNHDRDNESVTSNNNHSSNVRIINHNYSPGLHTSVANHKKRQLHTKILQKQGVVFNTKRPGETTNTSYTNNTLPKQSQAPTDTSSQPSLKKFIPSPQFDSWDNEYQLKQMQNDFRPLGRHFHKPAKFDAYYPPIYPNGQVQIEKWAGGSRFPELDGLKKDYPKFDQLTQYHQKELKEMREMKEMQEMREKAKSIWNFNNQQQQPHDEGQFVWIPNNSELPTMMAVKANAGDVDLSGSGIEVDDNKNKEQPDIKTEIKNIKGKWKWVPDADNGGGDEMEAKIVSSNGAPTYYERIKIYQEFKPQSITVKDHPYSFDLGNRESPFSVGEIVSTTTTETPTAPPDFGFYNQMTNFKGTKDSLEYVKPKSSPWKKIIHVLTAAIPIGLVISALTPHVVYINPNLTSLTPPSTQKPTLTFYPGRQRSIDGYTSLLPSSITDHFKSNGVGDGRKMPNPLMDFLNILSDSSATGNIDHGGACEDRIFCEISRLGAKGNSDVLYKMLWKIANETSDDRAKKSGLSDVFRAIKEDRCSDYECENYQNKPN